MRKQGFQHFTYQLPEDKSHRFVILEIYCELDISTSEADLRARASPLRVARMLTEDTVNGEQKKHPLPPVLAHIPKTERQNLLEMKTLSRLQIKIETSKKQSPLGSATAAKPLATLRHLNLLNAGRFI
ncbi:hypothetical protein Zmor_004268 [Zophobas morio]|uniref:Uncharacterized protein n=1 Tax=Zophobas morio TaxID=2755281 RepID=A0AA38M0D5_9CUCU|nr:hypothetical protein Zmor_004268 [Zophobas morio]